MKKSVLYRSACCEDLQLSDSIVYSTLAFCSIEFICNKQDGKCVIAGNLNNLKLLKHNGKWIDLYCPRISELSRITGLGRSAVYNSIKKLKEMGYIDSPSLYVMPHLFSSRYSVLIGLKELSPSENVVYSLLCRSAVFYNKTELYYSEKGIGDYSWLGYQTVRNVMRNLLKKKKIQRGNSKSGVSPIIMCCPEDIKRYSALQGQKQ